MTSQLLLHKHSAYIVYFKLISHEGEDGLI